MEKRHFLSQKVMATVKKETAEMYALAKRHNRPIGNFDVEVDVTNNVCVMPWNLPPPPPIKDPEDDTAKIIRLGFDPVHSFRRKKKS